MELVHGNGGGCAVQKDSGGQNELASVDNIHVEAVPLSLWELFADHNAPRRRLNAQERTWLMSRAERLKREGKLYESFCLPFAKPQRSEE